MTTHNGLPVSGYQPQSDDKVALVNQFKADEERMLRRLDEVTSQMFSIKNADGTLGPLDQRWVAIARTHFEQGFMALNRAVFRPGRVALPGDEI